MADAHVSAIAELEERHRSEVAKHQDANRDLATAHRTRLPPCRMVTTPSWRSTSPLSRSSLPPTPQRSPPFKRVTATSSMSTTPLPRTLLLLMPPSSLPCRTVIVPSSTSINSRSRIFPTRMLLRSRRSKMVTPSTCHVAPSSRTQRRARRSRQGACGPHSGARGSQQRAGHRRGRDRGAAEEHRHAALQRPTNSTAAPPSFKRRTRRYRTGALGDQVEPRPGQRQGAKAGGDLPRTR